jgi:methyl-accepting chemotaxis protein
MAWLYNLNIRVRLWLLTAVLIVFMIIITGFALNGSNQTQELLNEMYEDPLHHTQHVSAFLQALEKSEREILLAAQHAAQSPYVDLHNHAMSLHTDLLKQYLDSMSMEMDKIENAVMEAGGVNVEAQRVQEIKQLFVTWKSQNLEPTIVAIETQDFTSLKQLLSGETSNFDKLETALKGFIDFNDEEAQELYQISVDGHKNMLLIQIPLIVFGSLLGFVLSWLIIRGIDRGIKELQGASQRFADGNLTQEVDYTAQDEIGTVCTSFNEMRKQFSHLLSEICQSVEQLAHSSKQTSSVTRETQQGLSRQQDETSAVATSMQEMSDSMSQVKNNAHQAAEAAKTCMEEARQGTSVVKDTISSIQSVAAEVDNASLTLKGLEEDVEKMGSILDVIKGVAEQTNLLALNAAIEAARAGEQGRGFAVVADEVRTLASRTQVSTEEIQAMIQSLQQGAEKAVQVMLRSKEQAEQSVEKSNLAGNSLSSINDAVNTILQMNVSIASSVDSQKSVADQINTNIVSINDVARETAAGAGQTASASEDLAQLANHLKSMLGRFQV